MSNVVPINRRLRRVTSALNKRDGSSVEGLKQRITKIQGELADAHLMLLAVVRQQGRIRVERKHFTACGEGDRVEAEEDDFGNVTLNFKGRA